MPNWRFQTSSFEVFMGLVNTECSVLENWANVSLTSRDGATQHQLLPHAGSWPWMVSLGSHFLWARETLGHQDLAVCHKSFC
jgi:hypothetical protein